MNTGHDAEPRWHCLHVAYYDEQKDALITDAVRPLFEATGTRQFFTRHWRRGPHVRLNFHTTPEHYASTVRPAVDEIVGGYLAAHPSSTVLDPDAHLALHRKMAELEEESGPLTPWYPDNSINEAAYDDRSGVLGGPAASALLADYYVASTPLAFRMTEEVRAGASRLGSLFELILASAHAFSRTTLASGFVSFRSHAEAFLGSVGGDFRQRWNAEYARRADELTATVREVVDALDSGRDCRVREWVELMRPINERAREIVAAGQVSLSPERLAEQERPSMAELSPFHQVLENERWWAEVGNTEWFATYRLVLNFTYLHLTRLGVRPVERLLLCHLAANAVEEVYGVAAIERVRA